MAKLLPFLVVLLSLLVSVGCGSSALSGNYSASLELLAAEPTAAYNIMVPKIAAEPETLELKGDGTFITKRGAQTIWEGKWRADGEKLVLRATSTMGNAVQASLQSDVNFILKKNGTIVDDRTKRDGYQRVFKRG